MQIATKGSRLALNGKVTECETLAQLTEFLRERRGKAWPLALTTGVTGIAVEDSDAGPQENESTKPAVTVSPTASDRGSNDTGTAATATNVDRSTRPTAKEIAAERAAQQAEMMAQRERDTAAAIAAAEASGDNASAAFKSGALLRLCVTSCYTIGLIATNLFVVFTY